MKDREAIAAENQRAKLRLQAFEQKYGAAVLELATLAAFPMTLTTDLVCCLRENFVPDAPWYSVADILLSGLCESIGYDLFEMARGVQRVLLLRLWDQQQRVEQLQDFMLAYIHYRLAIEGGDRARILGDEPWPQWIALACLNPESEVVRQIRAWLLDLLKDDEQRQRLYLMTLLETYGESVLPGSPILQWVERLEAGQDLDEIAALEQGLGVQFREIAFVTATVRLGAEVTGPDPNARQTFEFETVQLDNWGNIVQRKSEKTWGFFENLGNGLGLEMVAIPGGEFDMGSPPDEPERRANEGPQHLVRVPPFFIGRYPVRLVQWRVVAEWEQEERYLNPNPSGFNVENHPVVQVSWLDAMEFCARLRRKTGRLYGLPSEAEWEYACRAGTDTAFSFGKFISPQLANYNWDVSYNGVEFKQKKSSEGTTLVGRFPANSWGLYDMHGNVWEWCEDHWNGNYDGVPIDGSAFLNSNAETNAFRVMRGGSWINHPGNCRSAARLFNNPDIGGDNLGFRIVCRPPRTL